MPCNFTTKSGGVWNFLLKNGTLLIRLHGVERLPQADGKAAVGIMDILSEPPAPQARDCFARHRGTIGLLKLLPGACPQFSPGNPHNHDGSSPPRIRRILPYAVSSTTRGLPKMLRA